MSTLFARLPESNPARHTRSARDLVASVALHVAAATIAVVTTLRANPVERPKAGPDTTIVYVAPRPIDSPTLRRDRPAATRTVDDRFDDSHPISLPTTSISFEPTEGPTLPSPVQVDAGPWTTATGATGGGGDGVRRGEGAAPDGVFSGAQVEVQASMLPGGAPRYPESLREARVEGRVRVRFVVDSTGRVERGSLHVVSSTNPLFTAAVRSALPALRFAAASAGGRRVRQLVELPFEFSLER